MKKTLADLLDPEFTHYRSIGELARTLQFLIVTSQAFRDPGRWGESGPTEHLVNYGGCTNSKEQAWHSGRITSACRHNDTTTWQQNHDTIYDCILAGLCSASPSSRRWQRAHGIDLHMPLKFPMAYQRNDEERTAWTKFIALHKHQLSVPTLNSCHRKVNILAAPELLISRRGISLKICVTLKSEMRTSPVCYSRWDFCFLTEEPAPRWRPQRETFAAFVERGVQFFRDYKTTPRRVARRFGG